MRCIQVLFVISGLTVMTFAVQSDKACPSTDDTCGSDDSSLGGPVSMLQLGTSAHEVKNTKHSLAHHTPSAEEITRRSLLTTRSHDDEAKNTKHSLAERGHTQLSRKTQISLDENSGRGAQCEELEARQICNSFADNFHHEDYGYCEEGRAGSYPCEWVLNPKSCSGHKDTYRCNPQTGKCVQSVEQCVKATSTACSTLTALTHCELEKDAAKCNTRRVGSYSCEWTKEGAEGFDDACAQSPFQCTIPATDYGAMGFYR